MLEVPLVDRAAFCWDDGGRNRNDEARHELQNQIRILQEELKESRGREQREMKLEFLECVKKEMKKLKNNKGATTINSSSPRSTWRKSEFRARCLLESPRS
mmetsp:Transcript_21551/g.49742  ORF Transcript_21551/g.49742 Transcript_21551/m.49742 type:complete len:101 (-) Transcript_21551:121-423(-)